MESPSFRGLGECSPGPLLLNRPGEAPPPRACILLAESANRRTRKGTIMAVSRSRSKSLSRRMETFSAAVTGWTGSTSAFILALGAVLIWLLTGPLFHFSDTWQLVINTATTVITFLMVFLIQRA